jgi:hypothetical protein
MTGSSRSREQKLIAGRRAWVDTTVVETDIRYPTDSRLLADGVRVLGRALKLIEQAGGVCGAKLRDRMRATTARAFAPIAARRRGLGRPLSVIRCSDCPLLIRAGHSRNAQC